MNEQVALKFMEQYIEMRRLHHEHVILLDEVYRMRSMPDGEPMAMTAQPRLEQLALEIEEAQNSLNFVADLMLNNQQLSYERHMDQEYAAHDDFIQSLRGELRP